MMQARWVNADRRCRRVGAGRARALAHPRRPSRTTAVETAIRSGTWSSGSGAASSAGLACATRTTPEIDYRERSPLVVPPSRDLPPPQAKATPKNPAWPNDPDVAKARKAAEAKRKLNAGSDLSRRLDNQGNPITPDQLNRPGGAPVRHPTVPMRRLRALMLTGGRLPRPSSAISAGCSRCGPGASAATPDETGTFTTEPSRDHAHRAAARLPDAVRRPSPMA